MKISHLLFNRLLLLALLPIIATAIYWKGQQYDPALIQFSIPGEEQKVNLLPQKIEGLELAGQIRHFTKENLYEYVNGHAEYFISAGFVSLSVVEYVSEAGQTKDQSDIIVEVYDMGKDIHAFGVLADEAGPDSSEVRIGSMGFKTDRGISFIQGPFYIKVNSFTDKAPYETIALQIAKGIPASTNEFSLFSKFPDLGKVVATRFIKEGYRGLDFLNNVIEREYSLNGQTAYVFLIVGTGPEINHLVDTFVGFFKENDIIFTRKARGKTAIYHIDDPYEGNWLLVAFDDTLVGIYGQDAEQVLEAFFIDNEQSSY